MEANSTKIAKLQAQLRELHTEQAALFERLTRAIAIKEIWPEAFEHGKIVRIRPSFDERHRPGMLRGTKVLIDITITRGPVGENGTERVFAAADLPPVLFEHFSKKGEVKR